MYVLDIVLCNFTVALLLFTGFNLQAHICAIYIRPILSLLQTVQKLQKPYNPLYRQNCLLFDYRVMVYDFYFSQNFLKLCPSEDFFSGAHKNAFWSHVLFVRVFGDKTTCVEMTHAVCHALRSEHFNNDRLRSVLILRKLNNTQQQPQIVARPQ